MAGNQTDARIEAENAYKKALKKSSPNDTKEMKDNLRALELDYQAKKIAEDKKIQEGGGNRWW